VPVSTFLAKIQGSLQKFIPGTILVEVASDDVTNEVANRIAVLLRDRHGVAIGADDDFTIKNLTETAARKQESSEALTLLLASIAAVSLLVGGIGIMNIMLVSVSERTREIGVRMAVGAKRRHVRLQFLFEAITLSIVGGLIGILLVAGGSAAVKYFMKWPIVISSSSIVMAFGVAAAVGIGFGLYPAHKASRLDPIQALRYE